MSTADWLQELQQMDFVEERKEDAHLDCLYNFRQRHSLRFAMGGCNIPEVIICGGDQAAEISTTVGRRWHYRFAAGPTRNQWDAEIRAFLRQCPSGHPTAKALLRRIPADL